MSRNQIIATDEVSTEIAPVAASAEPSVRGTVADFSLRTSIVESGSGPQDEDAEENEPKVTSSDPAIRKLARRLRIKRRVETIKKQHENEDEEESKVNKTALEIQVLASAENLEKLLLEGEELITNVLVGGDRCEVERREVERQLRQELLEKLDEEAREATAALEQINARWSELMVQDDPLDVHDGIAAQKTLCEDLLAQKDALIGELRSELDSLELEYEGALESQKEDLALLGTRIDSQAELMRQAYRHELQLLETTADGERLQSLEENLQAWRTLHQVSKPSINK